MRFKWLAAVAALAFIGSAHAQDAKVPALVYDLGGKFDKSFNEAAYNGAEKFKAETGVEYREFEVQNEFAARAGAAQLRPPRQLPDRRP